MQITLNLDATLTQWLMSQTSVQPEQVILDVLHQHIGISPVDKALEMFRAALSEFPQGIEFEVPQVLGSEHWAKLDRSTKLSLGKRIKAQAPDLGLEFLHKTSAKHAVYRRPKLPSALKNV